MLVLRNKNNYAIVYEYNFREIMYDFLDNYKGVMDIIFENTDNDIEYIMLNNENVIIINNNNEGEYTIANHRNGMLYREKCGIATRKVTTDYTSEFSYDGYNFYSSYIVTSFSKHFKLNVNDFEISLYNTYNTYNTTIKYKDNPSIHLYIYNKISLDTIIKHIRNIEYDENLSVLYSSMCEEYSSNIRNMINKLR